LISKKTSEKTAPKRARVILYLLSGLVALSPALGERSARGADTPSGPAGGVSDVEAGKAIYVKRCLGCHGPTGAGDGPAAERFKPRPRDFTRGLFKYKTTPIGSLPTDDDLFRVVSNGLPGTGMPSWSSLLNEQQIRQVIRYVKTFAPQFASATDLKPITIGPEIKPSKEGIEKGKELFRSVGCFMCHGEEGRGNGPLAPTLKDSWGRPVQPRNLTKNWTFRAGNAPKEIYTRINTGLMGTPMPSFAKTLDNEKSWAIANYVNSLSQFPGPPDWKSAVIAKPISGEVADDPDDPRWANLERNSFPLVGQVTIDPRMFTPTVDSVAVKAMYNAKDFSILVIWDDPTNSMPTPEKEGTPEVFDDALALQFPVTMGKGNEKPYFIMGDLDHPVFVARWIASKNAVEEFNANGQEVGKGIRIKRQDEANWQFKGKGLYKNGQYRAVFKRSLVTPDKDDVQIAVAQFTPMAFTAWDGSNGEHDAQRSLSAWYYLFLEVPPPPTRFLYPSLFLLIAVGVEWWITRSYRKNGNSGNGEANKGKIDRTEM